MKDKLAAPRPAALARTRGKGVQTEPTPTGRRHRAGRGPQRRPARQVECGRELIESVAGKPPSPHKRARWVVKYGDPRGTTVERRRHRRAHCGEPSTAGTSRAEQVRGCRGASHHIHSILHSGHIDVRRRLALHAEHSAPRPRLTYTTSTMPLVVRRSGDVESLASSGRAHATRDSGELDRPAPARPTRARAEHSATEAAATTDDDDALPNGTGGTAVNRLAPARPTRAQ